jgi:hypothetical protein
MTGFAMGNTGGFLFGGEMTFTLGNFELYNESEYLAGYDSKQDNFFYAWTDFTYSPTNWLSFGYSSQITKPILFDYEFSNGFVLGGSYKNFELSGYLYDLWTDTPFVMFALSFSFPE